MQAFITSYMVYTCHFAQGQAFTWSTLVGGGGEQEQAEPENEAKNDDDEMLKSSINGCFDDIGIVLTRPGHMVHSIVCVDF